MHLLYVGNDLKPYILLTQNTFYVLYDYKLMNKYFPKQT